MVRIQLTPEFPEHSENTELKMTWVSAMNVMAGIFIGNHDSRAGEPVFVKNLLLFSCLGYPGSGVLHGSSKGCAGPVRERGKSK